jgi:glycosyltransferase involved in cell wall biosynthesis
VAISQNQANTHPEVPWAAVVHNGLKLDGAPFGKRRTDSLCFVGRVAEEKGIVEAIEIALAAGRPLRIAAKVAPGGTERAYFENVFEPALKRAGSSVEFLGELDQADRDQLFAESYASLMPGAWPEPFGLVAIEALACGTPIIARRIGALPEIIRDGVDGFFGDDVIAMAFLIDRVADLDREAIRASVLERFSVERMTDRYEAVYATLLDASAADDPDEPQRIAIPIHREDRLGATTRGR